jgi:hypothetical protein
VCVFVCMRMRHVPPTCAQITTMFSAHGSQHTSCICVCVCMYAHETCSANVCIDNNYVFCAWLLASSSVYTHQICMYVCMCMRHVPSMRAWLFLASTMIPPSIIPEYVRKITLQETHVNVPAQEKSAQIHTISEPRCQIPSLPVLCPLLLAMIGRHRCDRDQ